jgi:hypothetical protein
VKADYAEAASNQRGSHPYPDPTKRPGHEITRFTRSQHHDTHKARVSEKSFLLPVIEL